MRRDAAVIVAGDGHGVISLIVGQNAGILRGNEGDGKRG
jgi:hypothetical protein